MAKWHGVIGFAESEETAPGVWTKKVVERNYYGDIIESNRQFQTADQLNDNINFTNIVSIVADPFANMNQGSMLYIDILDTKWKISKVSYGRPRLLLTTGGVYNGEQA